MFFLIAYSKKTVFGIPAFIVAKVKRFLTLTNENSIFFNQVNN